MDRGRFTAILAANADKAGEGSIKRLLECMRQEAEDCRSKSDQESDVKAKADLLVLAAEWDALAARLYANQNATVFSSRPS